MAKLVYLAQATRDIIEIRRFIVQRSGSRRVAAEYIRKLRQKCQTLAKLPGTMGSSRPDIRPDLRIFPFGNYIIVFRYRENHFEVVSILERHRDIAAALRDDR